MQVLAEATIAIRSQSNQDMLFPATPPLLLLKHLHIESENAYRTYGHVPPPSQIKIRGVPKIVPFGAEKKKPRAHMLVMKPR